MNKAVRFTFEVDTSEPKIHGLSMGHMTIDLGTTILSSKTPERSHMIFLTIALLLGAVQKVVTVGGASTVVGIDSSFELDIRRTKASTVIFYRGKTKFGEVGSTALVQALSRDVTELVRQYEARFDWDDKGSVAAFEDLLGALSEFESMRRQTHDYR